MSFPKNQKGVVPFALLGLSFLLLSLAGVTIVVSNPNARITINSWAKAKVKTWRDIGSPGAGRHAGKLAEEARVQLETQRAAAGITRPCQTGCSPELIKIDGAGAGILGGDNGLGGISGFYLHEGKYYPIGEEAGGPSTESLQYIVVRAENPTKPEEKEPEKPEKPAESQPSTKPESSTSPVKSTAPSTKPKASTKPAASTAPSTKPIASTNPVNSTAPSTKPNQQPTTKAPVVQKPVTKPGSQSIVNYALNKMSGCVPGRGGLYNACVGEYYNGVVLTPETIQNVKATNWTYTNSLKKIYWCTQLVIDAAQNTGVNLDFSNNIYTVQTMYNDFQDKGVAFPSQTLTTGDIQKKVKPGMVAFINTPTDSGTNFDHVALVKDVNVISTVNGNGEKSTLVNLTVVQSNSATVEATYELSNTGKLTYQADNGLYNIVAFGDLENYEK